MSVRTQRLADEIQKNLASLLQFEIKDPRVGFVTISGVDLSRDMSYADIYVTWMHAQSADDCLDQLKALEGTAGFLRSKLSKVLTTRIVPKLRFKFDETSIAGQKMDMLLSSLKTSSDLTVQEADSSAPSSKQFEIKQNPHSNE